MAMPTDAEVEAVAWQLAYDEWPLATEPERKAWASGHWREWKYSGKARNAIVALRALNQGP